MTTVHAGLKESEKELSIIQKELADIDQVRVPCGWLIDTVVLALALRACFACVHLLTLASHAHPSPPPRPPPPPPFVISWMRSYCI